MNNTDTKRQMPKKTEATSNADADAADAGPFFSHTCVYIIMRYKSGISHQRLLPLKRCMPYYHLMRISRLMQAMLFRNFFNFLFSKSYHPLPVLPPVFLSFFLRLFSFRRFSSPHSAPFIFLLYKLLRTRTFVRKKDLVLPRLHLKYSSALSLFLSFLSSLFRSYSQFYFLSLSDK